MQVITRVGNWQKELLPLLPPVCAQALQGLPEQTQAQLQEIRIRVNQPLAIRWGEDDRFVDGRGGLHRQPEGLPVLAPSQCQDIYRQLVEYSPYAKADEIRQGFVTLRGGYRAGICGHAVKDGASIRTISPCTAINLRIPRQVLGAANPVMRALRGPSGRVRNTLILSPPRLGKTTLIRDIIRQLSGGLDGGPPQQVALVDERSEIAACFQGQPQCDVGPRTDVMDGCAKVEGMMLMLRSMAPQVLATDEIGRAADAEAVLEALHSGVAVVVTAHGSSLEEVRRRPALDNLLGQRVFDVIIELSGKAGRIGRLLQRGTSGWQEGGAA